MRFYGFGNYYLSGLQQGLQAGHVIGELSYKAVHNGKVTVKGEAYFDWAENHKTMVLFNGGNSANLASIFEKFVSFEKHGMNLPYAKFHEDEQSLGGALTYVGIIVPEKYYNASAELRNTQNPLDYVENKLEKEGWKQWEIELINEMNKYRLAGS
jgi:hypothetical protein